MLPVPNSKITAAETAGYQRRNSGFRDPVSPKIYLRSGPMEVSHHVLGLFSAVVNTCTTSGQHPGDDVSRAEQDGFVLLLRDLDEA
jgi:hypothetical protein